MTSKALKELFPNDICNLILDYVLEDRDFWRNKMNTVLRDLLHKKCCVCIHPYKQSIVTQLGAVGKSDMSITETMFLPRLRRTRKYPKKLYYPNQKITRYPPWAKKYCKNWSKKKDKKSR